MAKEKEASTGNVEEEKRKIIEEKKNLKREQREQKRQARKRAKELAKKEDELSEDEESNGLVTFGATLLIVVLWLAVICVIIKLDVGGFGSTVLTPLLKNVPVINRILPGFSMTETNRPEDYGGYTNLKDAVAQIKALELELERLQLSNSAKDEELNSLKAEVVRLREFEEKQMDFQRIRTEFFEDVVYADKGPGAEEYRKYYEAMDPNTAEYIYKQVITQLQETKEIQEYASTYSQMKPKQAAGIFEKMTGDSDLRLVARILNAMNAESRGAILGVMDPEIAARLTKIMDPES
ncbi:MAG: MotE family protein [Acetatifactor sp.]